MDWFLYDNGFRHEIVNEYHTTVLLKKLGSPLPLLIKPKIFWTCLPVAIWNIMQGVQKRTENQRKGTNARMVQFQSQDPKKVRNPTFYEIPSDLWVKSSKFCRKAPNNW